MNAKYLILFFLILSCFFCENQKEDSPAKKMLTDPTNPLFYLYWAGNTPRAPAPECGNSDFVGQVLGYYNNLRIINLQVDTTYNIDTSVVNTRGSRMFQGSPNTNYLLNVTLNSYILPDIAGYTLQDCLSNPAKYQLYSCVNANRNILYISPALALNNPVQFQFSGDSKFGFNLFGNSCNIKYTLRISKI